MKKKKLAILGYSGLVGSNFCNQVKKKDFKKYLFNSKNIKEIKNREFDIVFCSALPSKKWLANKYPKRDNLNTNKLVKSLDYINAKIFILISTIDVKFKHTYGKNRLKLEKFVKKKFKTRVIIRLPGLFGENLKKNIIYDLLNNKNLKNFNPNDTFQWYDLSRIAKDTINILKNRKNKSLYEFYSEPVENKEILKIFEKISKKKFNINNNIIKKKKNIYNFKPSNGFFMNKSEILKRLKKFVLNEQ